jgi:hypothetical protein
MNRLVIFSFAMLLSVAVCAQTIKVNSKPNRIKGNACAGFVADLDGKSGTVEDELIKFLKEYGKPRSTTDYVSVTSPLLGGNTYDGKTFFATVSGDDKKAQVWIGIDTTEWKALSSDALERIEKLTYQFGVWFYRNQAQKEIDESQRAFDATEKQKLRLTNQVKDLTVRLGDNQQERTHLEKQLEVNSLEKAVLLQKIENNKKSIDSVANAGLQIKKVLDAQKEKQKRIN